MTTRVLGIDVSSETFHVALQAENGWIDCSFANSRAGFTKLGRWLKRNGAEHVTACVEASGNYWVAVASWLHEHGHNVQRANPLSVHRFIESDLERTKTDKQDARHIGAYLVSRLALPGAALRLWEPPSDVENQLRSLSRRLEELIASRTATLNRSQDPGVDRDTASSYRRELNYLDREIKWVEAKIDRLIEKHDDLRESRELMETIPGIGPATSRLVLAELGDCQQFDSSSQLVAFVGLCPQERQSGTSVRGSNATTRYGHRRIKRALYLPALTALRHDPGCKALRERHQAKGKKPMKTVVAVMHRLLRTIYGVLKNRTPYDPMRALNSA